MNVVVETTLVIETGWLPEFTAHLTSMVPVKEELRQVTDGEHAGAIGLTTGEEASEIGMILHVSLVSPHLHGTVKGGAIGHSAIGQGTHSLHSDSDGIKWQTYNGSNGASGSSCPQSVDPVGSEEEVRVLFAPIVDVGH